MPHIGGLSTSRFQISDLVGKGGEHFPACRRRRISNLAYALERDQWFVAVEIFEVPDEVRQVNQSCFPV
jgi:hypothetical protein